MEKKKNDKLLIILALLVLVVIIIAVAVIIFKPKDEIETFELPKDEIEIAEVLVIPNESGLKLIGIEGNEFDSISGDIIFHISEENEILYFKDNAFYKLSAKRLTTSEGTETVAFKEDKVMDISDKVYDFTFNNDNIAYLTDASGESAISITENSEVTDLTKKNSLTKEHMKYNVVIIDRNDNSKSIISNVMADENIILLGNSFIFNTEQYLNSYNFKTNESHQIYFGKDITGFDTAANTLIILNQFGNGNHSSLIVKLDENLNILKASKHEAVNVNIIQTEQTDDIMFVEHDNKPVFYALNMEDTRDTKKKSNLNTELVGSYGTNNSIYYRGYIYTAIDGKAHIVDLKSSTVYKNYDVNAEYVYPIFREDIIDNTTPVNTETE